MPPSSSNRPFSDLNSLAMSSCWQNQWHRLASLTIPIKLVPCEKYFCFCCWGWPSRCWPTVAPVTKGAANTFPAKAGYRPDGSCKVTLSASARDSGKRSATSAGSGRALAEDRNSLHLEGQLLFFLRAIDLDHHGAVANLKTVDEHIRFTHAHLARFVCAEGTVIDQRKPAAPSAGDSD